MVASGLQDLLTTNLRVVLRADRFPAYKLTKINRSTVSLVRSWPLVASRFHFPKTLLLALCRRARRAGSKPMTIEIPAVIGCRLNADGVGDLMATDGRAPSPDAESREVAPRARRKISFGGRCPGHTVALALLSHSSTERHNSYLDSQCAHSGTAEQLLATNHPTRDSYHHGTRHSDRARSPPTPNLRHALRLTAPDHPCAQRRFLRSLTRRVR